MIVVVTLAMVIVTPLMILVATLSVVVRLKLFENWVLGNIFWAQDGRKFRGLKKTTL
jgi:hypothetical protein